MSKQRLRSVLRKFSKRRKVKKQEHIEALSPETKLKKAKALKMGTIISDPNKQKDASSGIKVLPREKSNFVNKPKKAKVEKPVEVIKETQETASETSKIQENLDKVLEEIEKAKTPKGADEATRAEFNEKRKALRKKRDSLKKQLEAAE